MLKMAFTQQEEFWDLEDNSDHKRASDIQWPSGNLEEEEDWEKEYEDDEISYPGAGVCISQF